MIDRKDALSAFGASILSPTQWHGHTHSNLSRARICQKKADNQHLASTQGQYFTWHDNVKQYQNVEKNFMKKIDVTNKLTDLLADRISVVTDSLNKTRHSLANLQAACSAKDEPLQLCLWRLQRRMKRPDRELIRDAFEVALETERDTILMSQERLRMKAEQTAAFLRTYTKLRNDLQDDLEDKNMSMSIDLRCVNTAHTAWPSSGRPTMHRRLLAGTGSTSTNQIALRAMPPPPIAKDHPEHAENAARNASDEAMRQTETTQNLNLADEKVQEAAELRDFNSTLVQQTYKDCSFALHKVEEAMARQIIDAQTLKDQLQSSLDQTNKKIHSVADCMRKTTANLRAHHEPQALNGFRTRYRGERSVRENIKDPVTTAMDKHEHNINENYAHLQKILTDEADSLKELEQLKAELEANIDGKTKALEIDIKCRNYAVLRPERLQPAF